jgi:hypothetical protein
MAVPWWGLLVMVAWTAALGVLGGFVGHWWAEHRAEETPETVSPPLTSAYTDS